MADLIQHVRESGFPFPDRLIHVFVGGSELHGAKVQGTDDLDIYGVYVEPPELALGLASLPHFVWVYGEQRPTKWTKRCGCDPLLTKKMGRVGMQREPDGSSFHICKWSPQQPDLAAYRKE